MNKILPVILVVVFSGCGLQTSTERNFRCESKSAYYYLNIDDRVMFLPSYIDDYMTMVVEKNDEDEITLTGYITPGEKARYTLSKTYGTLHDEYLGTVAVCRNIEKDGSTSIFKFS